MENEKRTYMINRWTKDETILALSVYCKIPFNKASNTNPEIVRIANLIGRTPASVKMKVGNFGSFDPELKARGIVGLSNTSKLDDEVWYEYCNEWEKLAYDSELIIARLQNKTIEVSIGLDIEMLPKGEERSRMVKQRINQDFFRDTVLASYNYKCCISGISNPQLIEACHIIGWSKDVINRTNPQNGLCLNQLFHKAYDSYLVGITPDLNIKISDELLTSTTDVVFQNYLVGLCDRKIIMPDKFFPQKEFLEINYKKYKSING